MTAGESSGNGLLARLYAWTVSLAASKAAEVWLAVIAFIESSFFLVPADVLFVPMALARPERAMRLALIATVGSVLGGIFGYFIGVYGFELIARPVLEFYGKLDTFEALKHCGGREMTMLLLITSGLAHIPPIKVVTILAGVVHVGLPFFIISCIVARGARFFALAWLLKRYGARIRDFIASRLPLVALAITIAAIGLWFVLHALPSHGGSFC